MREANLNHWWATAEPRSNLFGPQAVSGPLTSADHDDLSAVIDGDQDSAGSS